MTEKEFLGLFNDIDDKFIDEERESNAPVYPVKFQYTEEKKSAAGSFSWGSFAATAAVCAVAFGGIFAAVRYFGSGEIGVGNSTTVPYETVYTSADMTVFEGETSSADDTASDIYTDPESGELQRDHMPVMYETTLNCNGKTYTVTALLHRVRSDESIDGITHLDQNYIWGDVMLELSRDGMVLDRRFVYEECYGAGQMGGMPFDKVRLGSDYFKVLNMERDVLAYFTPNKKMDQEDEYEGIFMNAQLITVDDDEHLVFIQRSLTEEEDQDFDYFSSTRFKFTPSFDVNSDSITLHLSRDVQNPWSDNNTIFFAGDIPISFDFENYQMQCEIRDYKYFVYQYTYSWYSPLTLMNGIISLNNDILKYDHISQGNYNHYTVNGCYYVPFFTPKERRMAGEKLLDWSYLKKGYHIGDYYVQNAVSDYCIKENEGYPYKYQCVIDLYGNLNSTATAEKLYDPDGGVRAIKITLDREYCEGLFGIEPCIKGSSNSDKNFDDDRVCLILTEKMKDYYKVLNSFDDRDSVRVSLFTNEFSLSYHYNTGYYDGMTLIGFDDNKYTLEILD